MATNELDRSLQDLAQRFERTLDEPTVRRLAQYVELLLTWNASINLTGARSADALVSEHLPDAFALARLVSGFASLVDVGSGGGLPGVPLAVLEPAVAVTLSEPRAKRR